jgi:hypothetical protein
LAVTRSRLEPRTRGLPSLNEARAERRRAFIFGRVRVRAMPPQFWLWVAVVVGGFLVVYFRIEQGKLESAKGGVMAKQRAVAQSLGPKILPFRDKIERWTKELAGAYPGDFKASEASFDEISKQPGVYLRLRQSNALSAPKIRKAAASSLHDGFTSCFFVRKPDDDPTRGHKCTRLADCDPGLLCNEYDVCVPPPRPYNLRLAYRALRVLSTEWTDEVHEAPSELAVTAYGRDLDAVTKNDVPVAIEMLSQAEYFTLVLDEDPPEGLPSELPDAGETHEERVQRVPHFARAGVWKLANDEPLLRLRTEAKATVVPVGERVVRRQETVAAQQRQANGCVVALAVKRALAPSGK